MKSLQICRLFYSQILNPFLERINYLCTLWPRNSLQSLSTIYEEFLVGNVCLFFSSLAFYYINVLKLIQYKCAIVYLPSLLSNKSLYT